MSPLRARQKTTLLLALKLRYNPTGEIGHVALLFIARPRRRCRPRPPDASPAIPPRVRIPSPLTEPPVLVLWLNHQQFSGEPPQTPRVDSGCEPLPCTGSDRRLRLAFLATMRPALDPTGHRVVTPAFLALNKSPNKSCVFSKLTRRAQLPFKP
jgi:hypothetical protein